MSRQQPGEVRADGLRPRHNEGCRNEPDNKLHGAGSRWPSDVPIEPTPASAVKSVETAYAEAKVTQSIRAIWYGHFILDFDSRTLFCSRPAENVVRFATSVRMCQLENFPGDI